MLHTDAPIDHDGLGESFSPTDLLATALGTCVLTIMGIAATKRKWQVRGMKASIEKHMTQSGPRQIERLHLRVYLPDTLLDEQRRLLRRMAEECPVKRNLQESIDINLIWI